MKSARRRAREGLVQGLYQWLLTHHEVPVIRAQIVAQERFARADLAFFDAVLGAVVQQGALLDERLQPYLDRRATLLSPVERAILWIGAHELLAYPETPFRVIINEAVELAKVFGGTDGHKYVNGVLDRFSLEVRPQEVKARAAPSGG